MACFALMDSTLKDLILLREISAIPAFNYEGGKIWVKG